MKTNKHWYLYEELGGYYKIDEDILMQCPINVDGTREDNPLIVDWDGGVSDEELPRMKAMVRELEEKD